MIVWVDAQLPPALARWLNQSFGVQAVPVCDLDLDRATDLEIYLAAGRSNAVVMTKDRDFSGLSVRLGPPPQVILIRVGNSANDAMKQILRRHWPRIVNRLAEGAAVVEVEESS